jgi:hypothetical protein
MAHGSGCGVYPQQFWRDVCVAAFLSCSALFGCAARQDASVDGAALGGSSSGALVGAHELRFPGAALQGESRQPIGPLNSLAALSNGELWAAWNSLRGDAYALDEIERFIEDGQRPECDPTALVRHGGTHLRYRSRVLVNPAFVDRLERFERVASEVAKEIYGRAPSRLQHLGAYSCRPSRRRAYRLSEHALGNAIDVMGFDFARAARADELPAGLPKALRGAFQVRIERHWQTLSDDPAAAAHARFLHELSARLRERSDVFRVMIGPSRRDHADHFHFDMSPWRYVHF